MKFVQRIILINLVLFIIHLSALGMEDIPLPENDRCIYFYRVEAPVNNPLPTLYILGGCHVISITKLPQFVREIFEECKTFVPECSEIHLPNYFEIHLNNMKKLGYEVTPETLVQMEINSQNMVFYDEGYEREDRKKLLDKYSAGWTNLLKNPGAFKEIIESHGLELEMINTCHPNVIHFGILKTLIRWEMEKEGMDMHFFTQAAKRSMTVIGLETDLERANLVCKQCLDTVKPIPLENFLKWIGEVLEELENLSLPENKQAIEHKISEATIAYSSKEIENDCDESVFGVKERNAIWLPKYKEILLGTDKPVFSCVGLNHVIGKNGLISLMQQDGYRITQATLDGFSD